MSYLTQSKIAADSSILLRLTACAAIEGVEHPSEWVNTRVWQVATQPGWHEAYGDALAAGGTDPGADEAVITDGMILSAVQSLI